jgi:hypothetical protein
LQLQSACSDNTPTNTNRVPSLREAAILLKYKPIKVDSFTAFGRLAQYYIHPHGVKGAN